MVVKVENLVGFLNGSSDIEECGLGDVGCGTRVCQLGSTEDEEDEKERTHWKQKQTEVTVHVTVDVGENVRRIWVFIWEEKGTSRSIIFTS